MNGINRRHFLAGTAAVAATGWSLAQAAAQSDDPEQIYGSIEGEPFAVPAINLHRIKPGYLRTMVAYQSNQPAGTIVIDPSSRYLYLTDGNGGAMRYGVGVGRQGFAWSGNATIKAKREWPDWYPPKEMLARDPSIMQVMSTLQSGIGMHGGPGNPLGARAMYLFQGNKDTLYRIHGTVEPWTIGTSVSSGCIRMINQDVIDLFSRVPVGTNVVVLGGARPRPQPEVEQDFEDAQPAARFAQPEPAAGYDPTDPYGFESGQYDPNR